MTKSLDVRNLQSELMDQPGLDEQEHRTALRGLGRINRISGSVRILWPSIQQLAAENPDRPLRVLDIACGGGDVAVNLWQRGQSLKHPLIVHGCDVSPLAVTCSREYAARHEADVTFFEQDAINVPLPTGYDVLTSSLFLHHLGVDEAKTFLQRMSAAAGQMILVHDLCRSRLGWLMAVVGCRLLTRSAMVRFDGPVSVRGAFRADEALELCQSTGLTDVTLSKHWPQRFLLTWKRSLT